MTPDEAYARAIADIADLAESTAASVAAMPATAIRGRVYAANALLAFADELRAKLLTANERPLRPRQSRQERRRATSRQRRHGVH